LCYIKRVGVQVDFAAVPNPLASWFRRVELDRIAEADVARAIREAGADALPHPNRHVPGDPARLRGLPLLVRGGMGGAVKGSDPLREVLRREREQERGRRRRP
jgi:hypothetical protein